MTSPLEQSERAGRLSFPTFRFFGHEPLTIGPAEKANLAEANPNLISNLTYNNLT